MKKTPTLLLTSLFLQIAQISFAQNSDTTAKKPDYTYVSICALTGASFLFSNNKNGALTISFPYSVKNSTGTISDSLFTSKAITPFKNLKAFASPLYLEVGGLHSYYMAQFIVSFIGSASGYNYSFGYGRIFYLNRFKSKTKNSFVIKTFIRMSNTDYEGYDNNSTFYLGSIDNENNYITVLGKVAGPTYTSGRSPQTYTVKTLDIIYGQNEWAIVPGISISNNPYKHGLYWAIEMAYNVAFHERATIILTQDDHNTVTKLRLNENGIKALYNSSLTKSSPYIIDGIYVGAKVGFSIPSKLFRELRAKARHKKI